VSEPAASGGTSPADAEAAAPSTAAAASPTLDPAEQRRQADRVERALSRLRGLTVDAAKVKKARRRLEKAEADVARTARERDRLKWLWIPMLTTWPIGYVWHGWIALYIFLAWFSVYGVGRYLSWGHQRNAVERLAETRAEVTALTLLSGDTRDDEAAPDAG
jgi:cytochrome c-type biogenesis protein CcmH/NrfG